MKIIDADKFAEQLEEYFYYLTSDGGLGACSAIQEMLEDQPAINPYEWISVEDRLPNKNQDVLIYRGNHIGDMMYVYTYLGNNEWEDEYGYWTRTDDEGITHWQPLPEPPKED